MIPSITPHEHQQLYDKIKNFPLDDPFASLPFSQRLARDNGWTAEYTQRVISEYKRFLYLCCISNSPVTPSEAVDQAWHQHLTYTRSYWTALCGQTIGRDIHHDPTKGGKEETERFSSQYQQTLALYELCFGEVPPPDIWPQGRGVSKKASWVKGLKQRTRYLVPAVVIFASFFIAASGTTAVLFFGLIAVLLIYGLQRPTGTRKCNSSSGGEMLYTDSGGSYDDQADGGDSSDGGGDSSCGSGCGGGCGGGD
jgi:hypothetical protein